MISFFKDQDLKETYDNQLHMIEVLKQSNKNTQTFLQQSPMVRKDVEQNFDLAQHNINRISEDLKAIHQAMKKYKELKEKIAQLKKEE